MDICIRHGLFRLGYVIQCPADCRIHGLGVVRRYRDLPRTVSLLVQVGSGSAIEGDQSGDSPWREPR